MKMFKFVKKNAVYKSETRNVIKYSTLKCKMLE
jgi:hypothetical protein